LKILLLDQGRQTLPFLKSFAKAGHKVFVVCNSRINEGYFSRYPTKRLMWPSYNTDPEGFKEHLLTYLKKNNIDVTLCLGDVSAEILSKNRDEISKYTKITVPEYSKFASVTDKLELMEYCMNNDIPCPVTCKLDREFNPDLLGNFNFPVIVKPRKGIGAMGVVKVEKPKMVSEIVPGLYNKYGPLLMQEYIPQQNGMQYQAQAFLDRNSCMKVCMVIEKPRFFPVNGGTSTANVTVENAKIVETCRQLLEGIGWTGAADVDLILDPRDNIAKVLEINPRVTAGIKIGFAAGIDYADLHIRYALGEEIPEIKQYKLGVYSRNIFMDLMWFIFSDREMKKNTHPPFFKFFGKDVLDQTISLDDPLTGLGFFLNMARKYMNIKYLREKLGIDGKRV
jgi:predicted ATP-grasp superfamily ATP-dependent carboligase